MGVRPKYGEAQDIYLEKIYYIDEIYENTQKYECNLVIKNSKDKIINIPFNKLDKFESFDSYLKNYSNYKILLESIEQNTQFACGRILSDPKIVDKNQILENVFHMPRSFIFLSILGLFAIIFTLFFLKVIGLLDFNDWALQVMILYLFVLIILREKKFLLIR